MNRFWALSAIALATCSILAGPIAAQDDPGKTMAGEARLVFLGADPDEGRPGAVGPDLSVLALPDLPAPGAANVEVLAALLRSNPVSTFVTTPDSTQARTGDLYLVTDIALAAAPSSDGAGGLTITLGGEDLDLAAFSDRLAALTEAFAPTRRQIGFIRLSDPDDLFPNALDGLRGALDGAGMAMSVLMVGPDAGSCDGVRAPLHYAVLNGLPDRAPFGDGDGVSTAAEVMAWLGGALARDVARGAPCAAQYSLILRGDDDPDRVLAEHGPGPLIPEMESAVYMETFEALFLMSTDSPDPIRSYLDTCTYCPNEADLSARLRDIGEREMALRLETGVWENIRDDTGPARLGVYLENCQLCAYRDEAEALIAQMNAAAAAREAEAAAFTDLSGARDLAGLRAWVETCVACDFRDAAEAEIARLETDTAFQAEQAELDAAMAVRNADLIADWLDGCQLCSGRDAAMAELARLEQEAAAAAPCVAAAGLPQQGGPRLLGEIDQPAARAACAAVLAEFPGNPLAVTVLGRIDQAAGNLDAARAAYAAGMAAGLPQAFGLAAHSTYAPGEGNTADYAEAERIALEGLARGDWLSGEVLTVLYSRELIEGRGPTDAFEIALAQAEEGNPVAQFFTGYFYRIGAGTDASDPDAADWFERSAGQGYLHANSFLAELYERGGEGVEADPTRAAELFWAALEGGDPTARERLTNQIEDRPVDVVLEVQNRLREAGVFTSRVDGIAGPNTANAVDRFVDALADAG